jgi:hypothetical protein
MAVISDAEMRKRHERAIAEAPNREQVLAAVGKLQARSLPFTAYDFGNPVTVVQVLEGGFVRFVFPEGGKQGERTSFASRLTLGPEPDSKRLVPRIEMPKLDPVLEVGKGPGLVTLYVWKQGGIQGNVRWLLRVPADMQTRYPGRELTLALRGCGSAWTFATEVSEVTRQTAYRCMKQISEAFGGARAVLKFDVPPKHVLDEGGGRG